MNTCITDVPMQREAHLLTVNPAKRRSDVLVRYIDDLRAGHENGERRASVGYSGDGGVTRTPACDMALATG